MVMLKPGDKVDCLVKDNTIVHPYQSSYDFIWTLEIIAAGEYGYYLFIPQYYHLKGSIVATTSRCKAKCINPRFLDEQMAHITENLVYRVSSKLDGMNCSSCGDFVLMGAPNQQDGSLVCYSCRRNPYR